MLDAYFRSFGGTVVERLIYTDADGCLRIKKPNLRALSLNYPSAATLLSARDPHANLNDSVSTCTINSKSTGALLKMSG